MEQSCDGFTDVRDESPSRLNYHVLDGAVRFLLDLSNILWALFVEWQGEPPSSRELIERNFIRKPQFA
jgi:hypothetical protein